CRGAVRERVVDALGEISQVGQLVIADVLVERAERFRVDAAALDQRGGDGRPCLNLCIGHDRPFRSTSTTAQSSLTSTMSATRARGFCITAFAGPAQTI